MLILTRRIGESLKIGHNVTVVVLGVKGSQVRFGIDAPREIPVHREEVYALIRQEQSAGPDRKQRKQPDPDQDARTGR